MKKLCIPSLVLLAAVSASAQNSAWLPAERQFVATPGFTFSTFDEFWMGEKKVDNPPNGKSLDQYVGYVGLEYGLLPDLAADVTVGYTWTDTDAFGGEEDDGLADTTFGLRYRLWDEFRHTDSWLPSVAVRIGGIIKGTYDENQPFSAGDGASGFETSLLLARQICPGFGAYGDVGYRVRANDVPDDFLASVGLYAGYKGFSANVGYRHVHGLSGGDIGGPGFGTRYGFPEVKEINQFIEAGVGYTDAGGRYYQFFYAHTLDGRNTGEKDIFGVSASLPFGGK